MMKNELTFLLWVEGKRTGGRGGGGGRGWLECRAGPSRKEQSNELCGSTGMLLRTLRTACGLQNSRDVRGEHHSLLLLVF